MAEWIDEAQLIAWIDGELTAEDAARVEQAIAADAELRALAETHKKLRARFAAAFAPIAEEPVALPRSADIISLAAVRSARSGGPTKSAPRWWVPGAIAASLVVGLLIGQAQRPDLLVQVLVARFCRFLCASETDPTRSQLGHLTSAKG